MRKSSINRLLVTFGFCCSIAVTVYLYTHNKKETYNKEEQKQYSIKFIKEHNVIGAFSTKYIKYDSIVLYEQYIEGCRWAISENGKIALHTIPNCPKCTLFCVPLMRE